MKWIFKITLTLNFLIFGSLVFWGGIRWRTQNEIAHPFGSLQEQQVKAARDHTEAAALGSSPKLSFHWSRLESSNDYRMYVANLRAIGCPEATVKDIVCGDAARAFACKRRELRLNGDGSGAWSLQRQKILVAELLGEPGQPNYSMEKTATTDQPDANETVTGNRSSPSDDLGTQPPAGGAVVSASAAADFPAGASLANRLIVSRTVAAPVYPFVLRNVNLDALGLTVAQKTAVQELQQQFINDVGGLNENPSDPGYLRRWQQAQPQSDQLLKAMLGITAWENYQLLAADPATPAPDPYAALNRQP
jgi:hypothetical protein